MPEKSIIVGNLPINIKPDHVYEISQRDPNTYTHGMFKYPCKFIPEIPKWAIKKYLDNDKLKVVFDPFSGSGTTMLETLLSDNIGYYTEIDPLAQILVQVKTHQYSFSEIKYIEENFNYIHNKNINISSLKKPGIRNLEHWFSDDTIHELMRIKFVIQNIKNKYVREFFVVILASIIKRCSNADDTSPKPYVSQKIIKKPPAVRDEFVKTYEKFFEMIKTFSEYEIKGKIQALSGDALNFNIPVKIDIAITSPPYINAFDYARTLRLENIWLDLLSEEEVLNTKKKYVGTESLNLNIERSNNEILHKSEILKNAYNSIVILDEKRAIVVKKFFEDMYKNLKIIYDNLQNGGYYIIVIGNSCIRKYTIESWKILSEISKDIGYVEELHFAYKIKNPYIRIPRKNKGGLINIDHILVLKKE